MNRIRNSLLVLCLLIGFHNLRHSLASFLIRIRTDRKTVQTLLRHSDVKLTLQF